MTYTAVGLVLGPTPTLVSPNYTFSFTPTAVHSFSLWTLFVTNANDPTPHLDITSVTDTQGNYWMPILPSANAPTVGAYGAVFGCISRTTSAATVTAHTTSSGGGTLGAISAEVRGKEFTSSNGLAGQWHTDGPGFAGAGTPGTTMTGFAVTTTRSGLVIFEEFQTLNTGSVGSTSGFAYQLDTNTNVFCWALNSTGAAQTPTATQTSGGTNTYDRWAVPFRSDPLGTPAVVGMGTM